MLFDLRGRGRRRTVQVIYAGLAFLIGAGLIFFGVGAGIGGGGILNSLTGNEGAGSASFAAQIEKYEKLTKKEPSNAHAWEQLAFAQLHESAGEAYVANQRLTRKGAELYGHIARSWQGYLAQHPPTPNPELALQMVTVYGLSGLAQPSEAVKALQIVIPAKAASTPQYRASLYATLAQYAYMSSNPHLGDHAASKALALAPAAQRKQLKTTLAEIKAHPNGTEQTVKAPNGQTIKVKPAGNGTFTGTTTTPVPRGSSKGGTSSSATTTTAPPPGGFSGGGIGSGTTTTK